MITQNIQLISDYKGGFSLICPLQKDCISQAKAFINEQKDKPYDLTIKEHREKRSLSANSYFWVLCGKLAEKLRSTDIEIYRNYIRQMGIFKSFEISDNAVDTFIIAWGMNGKGWIAEKIDGKEGFSLIHAHYGSSVYNKKQMARLIDFVVEDCKEQNIETMTPAEIEALKSRWGELTNKNKEDL